MKVLLAGDIGGTKTALGLFSPEQGPRFPLQTKTYPNDAYPDLETIVDDFLGRTGTAVDDACFGAAGPVFDGRAKLTNRPWIIHEGQLSERLRLPKVRLLNDLVAMAEAIPLLREGTDLLRLNTGAAAISGHKAIIAPGTGLGEAFSVWNGSAFQALPSEGGHCDFAPRNMLESELLDYLRGKLGHVSYENICSGLGIQNIYEFLKDIKAYPEPPAISRLRPQPDDLTPLILDNALDPGHGTDICRITLEIFLSALGAEAGNLALKILATGGVYLGGGIPRRIFPRVSKAAFLQSFKDKGRFSGLMDRIPVYVIVQPDAALIGAAQYGLAALARTGR